MNNTLELRSTFHFSDVISDMPLPISRFRFLKRKFNKKENSTSQNLYKNNKNATAIHFVQIIKDCMDAEMRLIIEPFSTKKLVSLIRNSFIEDDLLSISNNSSDIIGFNLGANKETCNHFRTKYFIRKGDHKGNVLFHIPAFVPLNEFNAPKEATNFKITTKLMSISNFQLDKKINQYYPLALESHGLAGGYETPMLPLIKIQTQPIFARLHISGVKSIQDNTKTILFIAIKYYKYRNSKFKHLINDGCLGITEVF